jgi:methylenetetrahydrofolate reductase (NADH)
MLIKDIIEKKKVTFSFEFFPPKDEKSSVVLFNAIKNLNSLKPSFVSITYGAGGGTRQLTHDLVVKLKKETNLTIASHLTCVGSTKDEIKSILKNYDENGITNIMALRGDPPSGSTEFVETEGGFKNAVDLVKFIKNNFPHMGIGVAGYPEGHPETPNRLLEMDYLKEKVDAGADYICTQLFYDNRDFYDFRERCVISGINVPIIAGIMPVTSMGNIRRMSNLALGTKIPAKLMKALQRADNTESVRKLGIHWATEQVLDLIYNNVSGIHFYTLNRSKSTLKIYDYLGVSSSDSF